MYSKLPALPVEIIESLLEATHDPGDLISLASTCRIFQDVYRRREVCYLKHSSQRALYPHGIRAIIAACNAFLLAKEDHSLITADWRKLQEESENLQLVPIRRWKRLPCWEIFHAGLHSDWITEDDLSDEPMDSLGHMTIPMWILRWLHSPETYINKSLSDLPTLQRMGALWRSGHTPLRRLYHLFLKETFGAALMMRGCAGVRFGYPTTMGAPQTILFFELNPETISHSNRSAATCSPVGFDSHVVDVWKIHELSIADSTAEYEWKNVYHISRHVSNLTYETVQYDWSGIMDIFEEQLCRFRPRQKPAGSRLIVICQPPERHSRATKEELSDSKAAMTLQLSHYASAGYILDNLPSYTHAASVDHGIQRKALKAIATGDLADYLRKVRLIPSSLHDLKKIATLNQFDLSPKDVSQ